MYNDFFGFREAPFSIAPDPRYLYLSERHKEALAHLMYGVQGQGGFIVITGEVGTGKTTVCRCFLDSVPDHVDVALVLNPKLSARELLASICDELRLRYPAGASIKRLIDVINSHLLASHAQGRHTVLVIDEAQNLAPDVLEQLRLLTNLETAEKKLLQIVLLGQPELQEILAQRELRQLAQRVTARYHLNALDRQELLSYIRYRLSVAGSRHAIFLPAALKALYRLSNGIPRLINLIADRALLGAYSQGAAVVDARTIRAAAREVLGVSRSRAGFGLLGPRQLFFASIAACVIAIVALTWTFRVIGFPGAGDHAVAAVVVQEQPALAPADTQPANSSPGTPPEREVQAADNPAARSYTAPSSDTTATEQGLAPPHDPMISVEPIPVPSAEIPPPLQNESVINPDAGRTVQTDLLAAWLPGPETTTAAYQALFQAWGVQYSAGEGSTACAFAGEQGLSCLHRQGNWRSLEQLDRPAILKVHNASGEGYHLTLLSLRGEEARIVLEGKHYLVSRGIIDSHWLGEYSVLWRLPLYETAADGIEEARTVWLLDALGVLRMQYGVGETRAGELAAAPLQEQVAWFQRRVGLIPDGIPGTVTLIRINSELDPSLPRLSARLDYKHLARQD